MRCAVRERVREREGGTLRHVERRAADGRDALEFTGAHDWGREFRHRNDEILYVADGAAEVEADGNFYRLERGDTLYCAGGLGVSFTGVIPVNVYG
ncbi:hypothetical protein A6A29_29335 [Streptomyces sp. TSRI0281]|nr:hypothetical protein A6A29_29335 [Streptomyces sp. TSRI0281]